MAQSLEQQDANNQQQRDGRDRQPRGPGHSAADPPQQRAAHHNRNNDIELQSTLAIKPLAGFIADDAVLLPHEFDAERLAALPHHFAGPPGAGVDGESPLA